MKKNNRPLTKVKNPEPKIINENWVIWAAWADRITFEEIREKSGFTEGRVIKLMRKSELSRKLIRQKIDKYKY